MPSWKPPLVLPPRMQAVADRWLAARRLTDAPATAEKLEIAVRRFGEWLADVPGFAPITSRDAPKLPQRIPRFIPDHELDLVMPVINDITCPFQRAALLVARWSGARRDEIRHLPLDC